MGSGLVFAGDLHASDHIYSEHLGMTGDSKFALEQISDFCTRNGVPLVLLGDNFDTSNPDAHVLQWFLECLRGVDVAFIQGQHCRQREVAWPAAAPVTSESRVHLDGQMVTLSGFNVYGLDCTPRSKINERLQDVPEGCDILCLHQLLKQVMGIESEWHLDAADIPKHVRLTVMGDYHGLPNQGEDNGRKWVYTGSSTMRSVSEPPHKSFVTVIAEGDNLVVDRVLLKTRPFLYNSVRWDEELDTWVSEIPSVVEKLRQDAIDNQLPKEVQAPFVAVNFSAAIDGAYERIMETLAKERSKGLVHLHTIANRKMVEGSPDLSDSSVVVSTQDAVDESVDKELCPELHAFVTDLAHASNPKAVIHDFKQRNGVVDDPMAVSS